MTIDVYADLACPWCYIGERRLFAALGDRPTASVEPRWRPFQLQPGLPEGGVEWRTFAETKFGSWGRARDLFKQVAAAGERDGIHFRLDSIPKAVNTADAHRLILFASREGRTWALARRLFRAYFEEGIDIGDAETLVTLAAEEGLDAAAARAALASGAFRAEVIASQGDAQRAGIQGVPFYIFDGQYAVSGAQPVGMFTRLLDRLAENTQ